MKVGKAMNASDVKPGKGLGLPEDQRQVLKKAVAADWLEEPASSERAVYVELWRAGLLRMNGGPGYQITRLGRESLARSS